MMLVACKAGMTAENLYRSVSIISILQVTGAIAMVSYMAAEFKAFICALEKGQCIRECVKGVEGEKRWCILPVSRKD